MDVSLLFYLRLANLNFIQKTTAFVGDGHLSKQTNDYRRCFSSLMTWKKEFHRSICWMEDEPLRSSSLFFLSKEKLVCCWCQISRSHSSHFSDLFMTTTRSPDEMISDGNRFSPTRAKQIVCFSSLSLTRPTLIFHGDSVASAGQRIDFFIRIKLQNKAMELIYMCRRQRKVNHSKEWLRDVFRTTRHTCLRDAKQPTWPSFYPIENERFVSSARHLTCAVSREHFHIRRSTCSRRSANHRENPYTHTDHRVTEWLCEYRCSLVSCRFWIERTFFSVVEFERTNDFPTWKCKVFGFASSQSVGGCRPSDMLIDAVSLNSQSIARRGSIGNGETALTRVVRERSDTGSER